MDKFQLASFSLFSPANIHIIIFCCAIRSNKFEKSQKKMDVLTQTGDFTEPLLHSETIIFRHSWML